LAKKEEKNPCELKTSGWHLGPPVVSGRSRKRWQTSQKKGEKDGRRGVQERLLLIKSRKAKNGEGVLPFGGYVGGKGQEGKKGREKMVESWVPSPEEGQRRKKRLITDPKKKIHKIPIRSWQTSAREKEKKTGFHVSLRRKGEVK